MGARECVLRATSIDQVLASLGTWNSKGAPFVTDIHAQYTFLSHPRGWACDCWHFERCRHADQRGGHERSGRLLIVFRADEMEEMAAGAHEMLPRIRHRPLQLSLVSALTR